MNKLYSILLTATLLCSPAFAAFPTRSNVATSDVAKVTGNWDSFSWRWAGYESQAVTLTVKNGASTVDMTGFGVGCKISRRDGTNLITYVDYTTSASNITIATSTLTFSVPYTNIPTDGRCLVELWAWEGAATNLTRTIAQGTIVVFNSIYGVNDSLFPFPSGVTNLIDYVPFTDLRYQRAITNGLVFTNGTVLYDGVLNGTNGIFIVPSGSTNRYWLLCP